MRIARRSPGTRHPDRSRLLPALALAAAAATQLASGCGGPRADVATVDSSFAAVVESLSEPGGHFDTDNLITNERSYLHPVTILEERGVRGGAYIGVGAGQNFSYIAHTRPTVAFIVDIRRDNLLHHLLHKALFTLSAGRAEYLGLLFGRPITAAAPGDREARSEESRTDVEALLARLEATPLRDGLVAGIRERVDSAISTFGLDLTLDDWRTIDRFHREFMDAGPSIKFRSHGRAPRFYYPTYRELLLERDLLGRRASFLASEEAFHFVKQLQARHRIVPVVGDLAGPHAVRAIGDWLEERGLRVSVFYASNVEFYLFRSRTYPGFVRNLEALPHDDGSVIIRSVFHSVFGPHPDAVPGYYSTQVVQPISALLAGIETGRYRGYRDVVTLDALE